MIAPEFHAKPDSLLSVRMGQSDGATLKLHATREHTAGLVTVETANRVLTAALEAERATHLMQLRELTRLNREANVLLAHLKSMDSQQERSMQEVA